MCQVRTTQPILSILFSVRAAGHRSSTQHVAAAEIAQRMLLPRSHLTHGATLYRGDVTVDGDVPVAAQKEKADGSMARREVPWQQAQTLRRRPPVAAEQTR
jgi:hypothetical protein